jgi:hypothetical protein
MAVYYFDLRDGEELIVDDEGVEWTRLAMQY